MTDSREMNTTRINMRGMVFLSVGSSDSKKHVVNYIPCRSQYITLVISVADSDLLLVSLLLRYVHRGYIQSVLWSCGQL